ncbi:DsbA family protein [Acidiphilium sp.]|uniref:DsbA family protein n=1 Tax=Acidiphilium sp. TaxID=527 RepID=UPI00258DE01A|nr:DsbA family protein [Acidiphilium sp.]
MTPMLPAGLGRRASLLGVTGWLVAATAHAQAPKTNSDESVAQTQNQQDAMGGLVTEDLLHDATSPVLGNRDGDVTMVEFFDYRCPYCKVMAPRLTALIGRDPGLRLVMKEYPVLSRESIFAAKVALIAARHGVYAGFHKAMFGLSGQLDDQKTLQVAQSVGLSNDAVRAELGDREIAAELRRNLALGQLIGVRGTPAFIVDRGITPGAVATEVLAKMVEDARKKPK